VCASPSYPVRGFSKRIVRATRPIPLFHTPIPGPIPPLNIPRHIPPTIYSTSHTQHFTHLSHKALTPPRHCAAKDTSAASSAERLSPTLPRVKATNLCHRTPSVGPPLPRLFAAH
jgi:hypothetical protein